ncbi:unnamed protein product [Spirodela intermedia]|uniref:Uncharacterized protein n=1 Tax=Spirodela intermedia TaxID=51605 RepID=A0A7I8KNE0_SPIIN|nr:unnamed protein product [Spirodela intermedia]
METNPLTIYLMSIKVYHLQLPSHKFFWTTRNGHHPLFRSTPSSRSHI